MKSSIRFCDPSYFGTKQRHVPGERVDANAITKCLADRIIDDESDASVVAKVDESESVDASTATSSTAASTATPRQPYNDSWNKCYEGFFDKLADVMARIMGCDECSNCCGMIYDGCTFECVDDQSLMAMIER